MPAETIIAATALIVIILFAFFGALLMAGQTELQAAVQANTDATNALIARIAALPIGFDTQPQIDELTANTSALNAAAQPTP